MKKKLFSLMLALVMVLSAIPMASVKASAATSGKIGSSTYCTVKINDSLINKRGRQYATVKLSTYDRLGWFNNRATVNVTLRDGRTGRYICSFTAKGGDTIRLGDDHSSYRIYVKVYDNPGNNFISAGNNFNNLGKQVSWKISGAKNCRIW